MKILKALMISSLFIFASTHSSTIYATDDPPVLITEAEELELNQLMDQYEWLFKILMPANLQSHQGAKKSFRVHLRDSIKFFPKPNELNQLSIPTKSKVFLSTGTIKYVGFFPKAYRYTVIRNGNGPIEFKVLIYFKNATSAQLISLKNRLKQAEELWNANRYNFGINYKFTFGIATEQRYAHFKPRLKEGTRGPYDTNWNPKWSAKTIAHELGHMMGLGDEYQTLSGKIDCISESLMCAGPMHLPFHHYHILRRLFSKKAIKEFKNP